MPTRLMSQELESDIVENLLETSGLVVIRLLAPKHDMSVD